MSWSIVRVIDTIPDNISVYVLSCGTNTMKSLLRSMQYDDTWWVLGRPFLLVGMQTSSLDTKVIFLFTACHGASIHPGNTAVHR